MKLLFVVARSDEIGGAHIHVRDLCSYYLERPNLNIIPHVVTSSKGPYTDLLSKSLIPFTSISSLGRSINPRNDVRSIFALLKFIRLFKPDLISLHSAKSGALLRLLAYFVHVPPLLFVAHGLSFANGLPLYSRIIYWILESLFALKTSLFVTVCRADYLLSLSLPTLNRKKIYNIYNGMPSSYPLLNQTPGKNRDANNIEKLRIITVARFEPQKDFDTLFKALSFIDPSLVSLIVIGEGSRRNYFQNFIDQYMPNYDIKLMGRSNNVTYYLDQSDLFVLSSNWEGFPRSILEAMRSSLPIVATDVGGTSESVIDFFNGFVVPSVSPSFFSHRIQYFIDNPDQIQVFGSRSNDLFMSKFTFQRMADEYTSLYKSLAS